jgi:hypothetical protein
LFMNFIDSFLLDLSFHLGIVLLYACFYFHNLIAKIAFSRGDFLLS